MLTVEVTVAASSSYIGFLESYAQALVAADTPTSRLRRWATELLGAIRPELRLDADPTGRAKFALAFPAVRSARDAARLAAEVFALPARIAAARKQRMAVALDEFQAIVSFDGGTVEHALRAAVQDQRQVGYVFSGSEPSLMERMLGPRRPFYKAGPVMRLEKINAPGLCGVHRIALPGQRHSSRGGARRGNRRARRQRARSTSSGSPMKRGTTSRRPDARPPASTIFMPR